MPPPEVSPPKTEIFFSLRTDEAKAASDAIKSALEDRLAAESRARQEVRRRLGERRDRLVAAQQEAMAVDANHVDEEGFAIFDRSSFLGN